MVRDPVAVLVRSRIGSIFPEKMMPQENSVCHGIRGTDSANIDTAGAGTILAPRKDANYSAIKPPPLAV
jgi:hypothetical protein